MNEKSKKPPRSAAKPEQYKKPALKRWGTLRELTQGGGGSKKEPAGNRRTRF